MTHEASLGNADERRARLAQAIRTTPDDAACRACQSRLDEYVAAQIAGEEYLARFADVALHLDACTDCAGAYGRLYELELAVAADALPTPEHLPAPDLTFLRSGAAAARPLNERLREAIEQIGDRIALRLSSELLGLLQPPPALAPTRAPADSERYAEIVFDLAPDAAPAELAIGLTAYRDARHPETCLVEVVVAPPGRSWPDLEGLAVTLVVAGEQHDAHTDAWGLASFVGIPIARLADMMVIVG